MLRFCLDNKITYKFLDKRKLHNSIGFSFNAAVREYQISSVLSANKKDIGIIVASAGSGKTVIALKIVADKRQPTLIVVHRKQLAEQWAERIENWTKNQWKKSKNGTYYLKIEERLLLIFQDKKTSKYSVKIGDMFGKKEFDKIEKAKVAVFEGIEFLKEKGRW
ncbi:DEAD/DEAH box helicase family protein [Dyadobacter sp. 3J3]|uniref:DEAD/DEAH box helicase family protein n=1 Tax=Dyadobacter sp. 3J3 TaxID=2606600 RepID=UPI00135B9B09|nr:DEAD/DEAH box helicase family protein [Dyadobacter sp. 3J3]